MNYLRLLQKTSSFYLHLSENNKKIVGTGRVLRATSIGRSKKEAVLGVLGELSKENGVYLRSVFSQETSQKSKKENTTRIFTNVIAADSFNYLKGVRVGEVREINIGGEKFIEVHAEAEGGSTEN